MAYLAQPKLYDQAGFQHLVATTTWDKWVPKFPVLHNTGVPDLKTYLGWGKSVHDRWGSNLNHYYQGMGWHSGPHIVACPDGILNLCAINEDGVHCSCWNHVSFGCEMVLDADKEDFTHGPGGQVRDNAAFALAVIANKLGWAIDPLVEGSSGLHFHRMCVQDHHACPGTNVRRDDMVSLIVAKMAALRGSAQPVTPKPAHDVAWAQGALNRLSVLPSGPRTMLIVDGKLGPLTKAALYTWQTAHGLPGSKVLDAATIASLDAALS